MFQSERTNYTIYGLLFGAAFPIGASLIVAALADDGLSLATIVQAQRSDPLLWIIDSAPIWLGWFASLCGMRQDRLREVLNERDDYYRASDT